MSFCSFKCYSISCPIDFLYIFDTLFVRGRYSCPTFSSTFSPILYIPLQSPTCWHRQACLHLYSSLQSQANVLCSKIDSKHQKQQQEKSVSIMIMEVLFIAVFDSILGLHFFFFASLTS